MFKTIMFENESIIRVRFAAEDFLNKPEMKIQLIDISWLRDASSWICIITYFTVD